MERGTVVLPLAGAGEAAGLAGTLAGVLAGVLADALAGFLAGVAGSSGWSAPSVLSRCRAASTISATGKLLSMMELSVPRA